MLASQPQFLHQPHQVGISARKVHFAHHSLLYQYFHVALGQQAQECELLRYQLQARDSIREVEKVVLVAMVHENPLG